MGQEFAGPRVTVSSPLRGDSQGMPWDRSMPATARWRRRFVRLRRFRRWAPLLALVVAVLALGIARSPWPLLTTLRHIAASPNCAAARAVGLAPAYRGQPGYWPASLFTLSVILCSMPRLVIEVVELGAIGEPEGHQHLQRIALGAAIRGRVGLARAGPLGTARTAARPAQAACQGRCPRPSRRMRRARP